MSYPGLGTGLGAPSLVLVGSIEITSCCSCQHEKRCGVYKSEVEYVAVHACDGLHRQSESKRDGVLQILRMHLYRFPVGSLEIGRQKAVKKVAAITAVGWR